MRIADRPPSSYSKISESLIIRYDRELRDMREVMTGVQVAVQQIDGDVETWNDFSLEETLYRVACLHVAMAVNSFCEGSRNFHDMPRDLVWTGWQWGDFESCPTEWFGQFRGKARAVCHWKLDVTDADMEALVLAGKGVAPGSHPLHPGFYASPVQQHHLDCTDDRVTENAAKACALVSFAAVSR